MRTISLLGRARLSTLYTRLFLALFAFSMVACPKEQEIKSAGEIPATTPEAVSTVGEGDLLSIRVMGEPDLSGDYRVSRDGNISFPWLEKIQVGGLLPSEVQQKIVQGLKDGYIRDPQVVVDIREANSKKIFVFGQVRTPGTFRYKDHMTVMEVITLAGGLGADADPSKAYITRARDGNEITYKININNIAVGKEKNVELVPGDILTVPQRYAL
jgi:protein involved in polysaccharide export with SLBB domain